jgi:hypothetical protein
VPVVYTKIRIVAVDNVDPEIFKVWATKPDYPGDAAMQFVLAQSVVSFFANRSVGINHVLGATFQVDGSGVLRITGVDRSTITDYFG